MKIISEDKQKILIQKANAIYSYRLSDGQIFDWNLFDGDIVPVLHKQTEKEIRDFVEEYLKKQSELKNE